MTTGGDQHREDDHEPHSDRDADADGTVPARFWVADQHASAADSPPEALAEAESILHERARQYAQAPTQARAGAWAEVLLYRVGEEQYASELRVLRSVHQAEGLAPVPCTPAYVAGILNVRGEVVTVLDLAIMLGLGPSSAPKQPSQVLLAELPQGRIGLLVDEALGADQVALDRLSRALSSHDFVRGVANARIVLLDLEQLLSVGHFELFEEVS